MVWNSPIPIEPIALAVASQIALAPVREVSTLKVLVTWFFIDTALVGHLLRTEVSKTAAASLFLTYNCIYFTTLVTLAGIYRLFVHPLRHFPGRRRAALTKLYEAYLQWHGRNALEILELHKKYETDIIRTGPNEVSIRHVDGLKLMQRTNYDNRGPQEEVGKLIGAPHVQVIRDNKKHRQHRAIWDSAFKGSALKDYNLRVEHHVRTFLDILKIPDGSSVVLNELISNMTFDIMADLGFGKENYGMQDGTADRFYNDFLCGYVQIYAVTSSLRNLLDVIPYFPLDSNTREFQRKRELILDERLRCGSVRKDIFSYFLADYSGFKFTKDELYSNSEVVIIAGSDTTASTLICLFRELALHPEAQAKLREEIDTHLGDSNIDCENTKNLPYLQAVIDETSRLWPVLPSGIQAYTGPEGATIAGQYIPPWTVTRVHHMGLMIDERYFPKGKEWIPERWTDRRHELIKDIRAFVPFSTGPHACVGKNLAMNEMRLVIASVVQKFEIRLAPGYDDGKFRRDWKDYFIVSLAPVEMQFVPRK